MDTVETTNTTLQLWKQCRFAYALFNQDELWINRDLDRRQIRELDARYASNICRFLMRRKVQWFWFYAVGEALAQERVGSSAYIPSDLEVPSVLDPLDDDPGLAEEVYDEWMRSTALFKALESQAQLRITP